ncbi:hypothetical protein CIK05_15385 [Bdellovibrio sp. qaytius]|nr:hypothetical protein CIK05_15385 [Bdellovibrio sp. qaytius]
MKQQDLKNITASLFFALTTLGCSMVSSALGMEITTVKSELVNDVTLTSRYTGGDFSTASYSFKFLSHDLEITDNNMDLIFEAREDFKDFFSVNMSVDDNSLIYDLGEKSCATLSKAETDASKLTPAITAEIKKGHCYLTDNNDESGRVVTVFHVAEHKKSFSVKINEIKVLKQVNLKN